MTQQQINWQLGQENIRINRANAEANRISAEAAKKQAAVAENSWGWNLGANLASTAIGALVAWLL